MKFVDTAVISDEGLGRTADGYLKAIVPVARTGVQDYAGYEVGKSDMARVRVYRPPEEVFADKHMASIAHKPLTNDHPKHQVTPATWKRDSIGWMGDTVYKDEAGGFIRVPMMFADAAAIEAIEGGKREVSMGYSCNLDWTSGVTDSGEQYDAIQRNIVANHCALVSKGRAGYSCRVGDNWSPIDDKEPIVGVKTITHDGVPIEVTDAAEAVINKLKGGLADTGEKLADTESREIAERAKVEAKDGEIAALKQAVADATVTPEKLATLVADRAKLIDAAKALHDVDYSADDANAIRRKAVSAKLGDAAKDMSDAAVEGAFAALKPTTDAFRETVKDGVVDADQAVSDARKAMLDRLHNPLKADA